MKRLLIVLTLVILCIGSVGAISSNFQTSPSVQGWTCPLSTNINVPGACTWSESLTGGNSVIAPPGSNGLIYGTATPTTYVGFTATATGSPHIYVYVYLYDSTGTMMGSLLANAQWTGTHRYEFSIVGGTACVYQEGLTSGLNGPACEAVSVNPSYVSIGADSVDDIVYGTTDPKWVMGAPDESTVIIFKDLLNPANHGIAYAGNHTVVTSTNMTTTFGRSVLGNNTSANVVLRSWSSAVPNTNYGVYSTGTAGAGTISWPIYDDVINNPSAPYGEYYTTVDGSGAVSNTIAYIAGGATVAWDAKTHSSSDKATISYAVSSGGYWNTNTYSYKMAVTNVFGQFQGTNTSISSQTGNATFQFTSAMNTGIYYAQLIATPKAGGADILMNYDYTTLNAFVNFHGYVNDAQTGNVISGANVSMVQSGIIQNVNSSTDGNYTTGGFITGAALTVNATGSGYRQYNYSFTPLVSKTVSLNISLVPSSPTFSSTSIGGVDRDTVYGQPISGARVTVRNTSTSESYYQTTSFTGWYLCDAGATCTITAARPYDVWGSIAGWANSTVYAVVPT